VSFKFGVYVWSSLNMTYFFAWIIIVIVTFSFSICINYPDFCTTITKWRWSIFFYFDWLNMFFMWWYWSCTTFRNTVIWTNWFTLKYEGFMWIRYFLILTIDDFLILFFFIDCLFFINCLSPEQQLNNNLHDIVN